MRIAVVGGGISGMTAAYLLASRYDVTLYEAAPSLGGHTHTVPVDTPRGTVGVDMGFIVFNEENYPGFVRLLRRLGVRSQPSDMSFGVRSDKTGTEFKASSLSTLFAQRRRLVDPGYHRMLIEVVKFRRQARRLAANGNGYNPTLAAYLADGGYSQRFIDEFIVPMGAAIWSATPGGMHDFPARALVRFFENHRFLDMNDQPTWRTVSGGSSTYVERIAVALGGRVRLRSPVRCIRRRTSQVELETDEDTVRYDHVVIGVHSDQALSMLERPTPQESEVLGAIPYQKNDTALHTDVSVMPRERTTWASWNVRVPKHPSAGVNVTYHSNRLQNLEHDEDFLVTLNRTDEIAPSRVIERLDFDHPIFTLDGVNAQKRYDAINGRNRTSYCGAYWGFGFHEDGVQSALAATKPFGVSL